MHDPQEKITIRPEELGEPPSNRITIQASELPADVTPRPRTETPLEAILVDDAPAQSVLPPIAWVGLTLVPLLNAWIWWRYAPDEAPQRDWYRAIAFLLGGGSLIAGVVVALYLFWPRQDWIERAASRADRSVVLIHSKPDSLGTGFVVASDGGRHLILTNRHVVTDAGQCVVSTRMGSSVPAQVVGYPKDEAVDLALLVAEAPGLRPMGSIASYSDVRVGEAVVAIGHPLGLDYTVTSGIISAKRGGELQTSAPISPGNSGGPLIDKNGDVVGVNTRTVDPAEGQSLSFAVRADVVLNAGAWRFEQDVDDLLASIER